MGRACERLERVTAGSEQPAAHECAGGSGDGGGGGERECARTGHDQHGDGDGEPVGGILLPPVKRYHRRQEQHGRNEARRDAIGQLGDSRFLALRPLEQPADRGSARRRPHPFDLHDERALYINGAADEDLPRHLRDRRRFPG